MKIAYNNNEAKKFDQVVNSARKGFKPPQILLIRYKKDNTVSNKEKVLQR